MRLFAYLLSWERSEKNSSASESFFWVVLSHWQRLFEIWQRKNFWACEKFFLTHSDKLPRPEGTWLRVRVAQCAMALRVMVQSHLGWPWECHRSPDTSFGWVCSARWMAPFLLPSASSHPPAHGRPRCHPSCKAYASRMVQKGRLKAFPRPS